MSEELSQKSPKKKKPSYLSATISIFLILFLVGLIGLSYYFSTKGFKAIKESLELEIILVQEVEKTQIEDIKYELSQFAPIKDQKFISKEEALKIFSKELGQDIQELAGTNPLYDSYVVHLKSDYSNIDSVPMVVKHLKTLSGVMDVTYSQSVLDFVSLKIKNMPYLIGGFCLLLLIIAFSLIDNTIRLSMFSQRFLIRSMQLIGATKGFIIKPFIGRAILTGIFSAFLAILAWGGILYFLYYRFNFVYSNFDMIVFGIIAGCLTLFGILVSLISTYFSVNKYLKMKLEELY